MTNAKIKIIKYYNKSVRTKCLQPRLIIYCTNYNILNLIGNCIIFKYNIKIQKLNQIFLFHG